MLHFDSLEFLNNLLKVQKNNIMIILSYFLFDRITDIKYFNRYFISVDRIGIIYFMNN